MVVEEGVQRPSRNPVAAIDCGTNTVKLLIGTLPEVAVREMRMVRLGEGVDTTGELSAAALARCFAAIDEYAALIAEHGVPAERIRFCATSASRDARNADVFAQGVRERLGVLPEVIAGEEEAALSFDGAVRNLREPAAPPVLVVDIGGGSTELVLGVDAPAAAVSLDIGSVRMHERHLHGDPATADQVAACVADVDAALDRAEAAGVDLSSAASVVGVAGTCTTVAAGCLDLPAYDRDAIDQAVLTVAETHAFAERLLAAPVAERLAMPFMHPGRADVIDAGALILDRVLRRTSVDAWTVSESDILDGIAWSVAARGA
ncbi:exopolyphosphatase [Nocardioides solisilvae]|uniref:Ppx/GppA phosphatase family protein n=1 Tax=Nocardioides solisilvae TaxID=1542435 RepID=UPI001EF6114A|nr:exopolyphosphatase [Nocardioides solisilvae]